MSHRARPTKCHRSPWPKEEGSLPQPIGLAGLFGLLLVKEAGLPIPVPGDLLVLGAGVAAAHGDLDPVTGLSAVLVAGYLGGSVQFALLRGGMRRPLLALLARVGLRPERVERHAERLRRQGAGGVAVARATPGLRVVAIAASALAGVPFARFAVGLIIGNTAFVSVHFLLGLAVGEPALAVVASSGAALAAAGVALAVVGGFAWWAVRRLRRRTAASSPALGAAAAVDTFADWSDATCPVCLVLGLAGTRVEQT